MSWQVVTQFEPWSLSRKIWIAKDEFQGRRYVAGIDFREVSRGRVVEESDIMTMAEEDAREFFQAMMNAAWDMGLRPSSFEDHTNELKATRYHLEDMRKIAKVKQ